MAAKEVRFSGDARQRMLRGVDLLADAVAMAPSSNVRQASSLRDAADRPQRRSAQPSRRHAAMNVRIGSALSLKSSREDRHLMAETLRSPGEAGLRERSE
jgi:hypothetical protein